MQILHLFSTFVFRNRNKFKKINNMTTQVLVKVSLKDAREAQNRVADARGLDFVIKPYFSNSYEVEVDEEDVNKIGDIQDQLFNIFQGLEIEIF